MDTIINNYGTINVEPPPREYHWGWAHRIKLFGLFFYVSNCRMKKRPIRDLICGGKTQNIIRENKGKLYERQGGKCPHCGGEFDLEAMEYHHILPYNRFPEWKTSIRNGILLCHKCHKEIHMNPFLNARLIQQKAEELGVDINTKYNIKNENQD